MQESYPERESGMLAVIGIEVSKLENILKQNDKLFFEIANDNAPGQIVISAKTKDFEKIQLLLKDYGAKKIIPLNVSAGFHSSFMKNAKNIMNEELNKIEINDSNIPVISNYSALPVKKSSDILEAKKSNKMGIIYGFQNSAPIANHIFLVEKFFTRGLRFMQIITKLNSNT